ncbi:MAG: tetratricopeptide repeat protein [Byssovorax sp.]
MNIKRMMVVVCLGIGLAGMSGEAGAGDTAADLFQKSYDYEAVGKLNDALGALDQLPSPRHECYVAHLRRGWLLSRLGRSPESIDAYGKAITAEPRSVEAKVGVLVPLMALRRWADTEAMAREALKLDPGNYLAGLRLAFSVYSLGRYAESAMLYRKLLDAYPSDVEVRAGLGWALLKSGKAADAAKEFREVLEIAPKNVLSLDGLKAAGVP